MMEFIQTYPSSALALFNVGLVLVFFHILHLLSKTFVSIAQFFRSIDK